MKVSLTGALRTAADGVAEIDVEATTIRELLTRVLERYPDMDGLVDDGIAVSINGEIFRDNWSEPIPADAEVFLLPRIQGG
jgi:molybdopterin synthase sulfur carrier subunit